MDMLWSIPEVRTAPLGERVRDGGEERREGGSEDGGGIWGRVPAASPRYSLWAA